MFSCCDLGIWNIIFYLGAYQLIIWTWRVLSLLGRTFFGTKCTVERYGKDSWAVVTGSTDGIGKAAAIHLAK